MMAAKQSLPSVSSTAWIPRPSMPRFLRSADQGHQDPHGTEVAARHFVYKLYDTTGGEPLQWHVLHGR